MSLALIAFTHPVPGQQSAQPPPPAAPTAELPNAPAPPLTASISGFVADTDGASIAGAKVILTVDTQPPQGASSPRTATTPSDGSFTFSDVPAGHFQLSVSAPDFAPQQVAGELRPGETRQLPTIALAAATSASIQVTASQTDIAEAQVQEEEKQRVLGVFPNFYVSYTPDPVPLDPKQKFELAARTLIDPVNFVLNGVVAGIQQADNTYNWGQGAQAYGKRYAAAYGTFLNGTVIGSAILPILLKQDPRYFYKGTGSAASRLGYAVATSVICKGDNHHWQVNYSAILGGLAAGGISNFYYPAPNRAGIGLTFEGAAIGTGMAAVTNVLQEFVVHKLTPHIPPPQPANPEPSPASPPPAH